MTSTIAITGAGGFIGSAIARRYLEHGWTVRGLDLPGVTPPEGIDWHAGDITVDTDIEQFVGGADIVVHTAALVAESGDWSRFHELNAVAPRRIAESARSAGATAFVHLSSVMVHGFDYRDGANEGDPFDPADNPYCWSKIIGEHSLRGVNDPGRFRVHIVRPGDVYGPGSEPWIKRPLRHMAERTFLYVDAAHSVINHVYIDNLVDAIEVIVDAGDQADDQAFIVTDGQRTLMRDFWGWFAERGSRYRHPELPGWVAEPAIGSLARILPRGVSQRLDLDRQSIRYLRRRGTFDTSRIRSLGWSPRVGLDEGRELTLRALTEAGITW